MTVNGFMCDLCRYSDHKQKDNRDHLAQTYSGIN